MSLSTDDVGQILGCVISRQHATLSIDFVILYHAKTDPSYYFGCGSGNATQIVGKPATIADGAPAPCFPPDGTGKLFQTRATEKCAGKRCGAPIEREPRIAGLIKRIPLPHHHLPIPTACIRFQFHEINTCRHSTRIPGKRTCTLR